MKPGIYTNLPESDYHRDAFTPEPSLSNSIAKLMLPPTTPKHAWFNHPKLNPNWKPREVSEAKQQDFDFGSAVHQMFLENRIDGIEVIPYDDFRKDAAKKMRDEARLAGKYPLLQDRYVEAVNMAMAAREQLAEMELRSVLEGGDAEVTAVWKDGRTWLRSRLDWLSRDRKLIVDYKHTGGSADPNVFIRQILNLGYDLQCAFYRRAIRALEGVEATFVLLVQEDAAPYLLSQIALTPQWVAFAEHRFQRVLELWENAMATGVWSAYPKRIAYVDLPGYVEAAAMASELQNENV